MIRARSTFRFLPVTSALLALAGVAFAENPVPLPPATIRVSVERVDPTSFPLVDVYFRVVDTVPASEFHAIRPGDVRVSESGGGKGAFQSVAISGDNFARPIIRPLAMALAVDRSFSIRRELHNLRDATVRFLDGMSDNGPLADDAVSLVLFSGFSDLAKVLHVPLTTDKQQVKRIAAAYLDDVDGGTPLQKAWNLAVRDVAESDYPARGVLMLTDGQQFPPGEGPSTDSIIQAAYSNALPVFNFGFVHLYADGSKTEDNVYRPDMIRMAQATDGAYFEPELPDSRNTMAIADLEKLYVDQISNMFTKVRASLKTLYRVTLRSSGDFRGEPRDLKLSVAYQALKGTQQIALTGEGVGRYITPAIAEEDTPSKLVSTLNPLSPVNDLLFGAGAAPRGGTWNGPTEIRYRVDLMGPGDGSHPVALVSRSKTGEVSLSPEGPAGSFDSKDREELAGYLSAVELQVAADPAAGTVTAGLTARTPTCVRDPDHPWGRPRENAEAAGFRKLLFYRIQAEARRGYAYSLTVPTATGEPGAEVAAAGEVKLEFPMLVAFASDTTSPTVAVYLTPQDESRTSRLEALELPFDASLRLPALLLTGVHWAAGLDSRFVSSRAAAAATFPLEVEGAKVDGFFVHEHVRVKLSVLARDNYDRNSDHSYLTLGGSGLPAHDRFGAEDEGLQEAREGLPPYLAHVRREEAGKKPGVAWWLEEDGVASNLDASLIFRRPNVPEGPSEVLVTRAADSSGNVTELRVPVKVLRAELEMRRISYESKRAD